MSKYSNCLIAVLASALLAGCGGKSSVIAPPAPVPPPAPIIIPIPDYVLANFPDAREIQVEDAYLYISGDVDPAQVKDKFAAALRQIRTLRPANSAQEIVVKIEPANCKGTAFFADALMLPGEVESLRQVYPTSFQDGRPCVNGYTASWTFPLTVYIPPSLAALQHEFLHAIWFVNWTTERCGGAEVWRIVGHGGVCDPFTGK